MVVAGILVAGEGRVADADSQVAVARQPSRSGSNASQAAIERETETFRSLTWQQRNTRRGSQPAFALTLALPASAGRE